MNRIRCGAWRRAGRAVDDRHQGRRGIRAELEIHLRARPLPPAVRQRGLAESRFFQQAPVLAPRVCPVGGGVAIGPPVRLFRAATAGSGNLHPPQKATILPAGECHPQAAVSFASAPAWWERSQYARHRFRWLECIRLVPAPSSGMVMTAAATAVCHDFARLSSRSRFAAPLLAVPSVPTISRRNRQCRKLLPRPRSQRATAAPSIPPDGGARCMTASSIR